jgi:hypothetical protein
MEKADLELYMDYLLSTFGAATATGLSAMVECDVTLGQITRFLSAQEFSSNQHVYLSKHGGSWQADPGLFFEPIELHFQAPDLAVEPVR